LHRLLNAVIAAESYPLDIPDFVQRMQFNKISLYIFVIGINKQHIIYFFHRTSDSQKQKRQVWIT